MIPLTYILLRNLGRFQRWKLENRMTEPPRNLGTSKSGQIHVGGNYALGDRELMALTAYPMGTARDLWGHIIGGAEGPRANLRP